LVINGGYFNTKTGQSRSLIIKDSEIYTINEVNEGTYRPTIGTFGMYTNKSIIGHWTYLSINKILEIKILYNNQIPADLKEPKIIKLSKI
jgi:hypothetical protein